jgi:hypothetical protein
MTLQHSLRRGRTKVGVIDCSIPEHPYPGLILTLLQIVIKEFMFM